MTVPKRRNIAAYMKQMQ